MKLLINRGFDVFALFFFTKALIPLIMEESGLLINPILGNQLLQIIAGFIFIIVVMRILFLGKVSDFLAILNHNKWLVLLNILTILSIAWSHYPSVAFRYMISLLGITIYAIHLKVFYTPTGILYLLSWTFITILIGSMILIPTPWGVMDIPGISGDWRGLFIHKNRLGNIMVLSYLCFIILVTNSSRKKILWIIGLFLSTLLLLGSRSATSYIAFFSIFTLFLFRKYLVAILSKPLITFLVVFLYFALVLNTLGLPGQIYKFSGDNSISLSNYILQFSNFLGKDETLSGRTVIWYFVVEDIKRHPFLGYGIGNYWLGWEGEAFKIAEARGVPANAAHNGVLDTLLNLGFAGLLLYFFATLKAFHNSLQQITNANSKMLGYFSLFFLFYNMIVNLSESTILERTSIFWILFILSAV